LDFSFNEAKKYLKDLGFDATYVLHGGEFKKVLI
jgi:rhodanese-related sulfurtransferase